MENFLGKCLDYSLGPSVTFVPFFNEGDYLGPVAVGCVAGDAESYILFCDFFDRVIEAYHEQKITSQTPESDLNCDNLKVATQNTVNNKPKNNRSVN